MSMNEWRLSKRLLLGLGMIIGMSWGLRATAETPVLRVGVLQYGTVSWELDAMRHHGFDAREGVRVEVVPYALNDTTNVALQGGAVDIIVNDWIWVSRQRFEGRMFVFSPYSRAVGALMVRPDAGIDTIADLQGKRLGIAGGPVDKSWLILRAFARRTVGVDAAELVRTDFAAPPLLNELMLSGRLPAVLNFWHFNARLKAAGMRELFSLEDMLAALGIDTALPMIGWVFREDYARANPQAIEGFLRASAATKRHLRDSDDAWLRLRSLMRVDDDAGFVALREGYRAGIPLDGVDPEAAARQVFALLASEGGRALVGHADALAPGTFWDAERDN